MKKAFTLAETLITLAIIGVVAAMTLPPLIQKHNNRIVETRLMKFYSTINQAVQMAEIDYGDKKDWFDDLSTKTTTDSDGNVTYDTSEVEAWCKKYLIPYMSIDKTETIENFFVIYFSDGSAFSPASHTTRDWIFYPGRIKKCINSADKYGTCKFAFNFRPDSTKQSWKYHYNKGFEPFKFAWDGDMDTLYTNSSYGCKNGSYHHYCTAIIQMNDWKIPDDYPYKVKY